MGYARRRASSSKKVRTSSRSWRAAVDQPIRGLRRTVAELTAAVEEAHQVGKKTTAHCLAAESIDRAVDAGIDQIEHFNFLQPDGSRVFDDRIAEKIVARGTFMSPTIQTSYRQLERLQEREGTLTPPERELLDGYRYKIETKLDFVRRFYERADRHGY